jgi:protein-glutamine gamma-glutamyltransferase
MARTAALYVPAAVLLVAAWTRLESSSEEGTAILLTVLALGPALVRPWWGRALAALAASVVAVHAAFDVSLLDARPRDAERDFFGPLLTSIKDGVLEFYDVTAPFAPGEHPLMHGIVLLAVFGFCVALGLGLAARRPVAAAVVLLVGTAWPLALVPGRELQWGAAILALTLLLLAAGGSRPPRALRPAAIAAAVLVVASLAAAAQPAVAKGEFLHWKRWDPYDKPDDPVGVRYVWDANYSGLDFPEKKTHVLTVEGPERSLYWRATTLDDFEEDHWVERLPVVESRIGPVELFADPLLPERAYRRGDWVQAKVTAHALADAHLVGAATPMRWDPTGLGVVEYRPGNVATLQQPLERGQTWTVASYAPRATPKQLARSRLPRPGPNSPLGRYIEVGSTLDLPTFGTPDREAKVEEIFTDEDYGASYREYRPLYERAREIVGDVQSPYAAVIALETWFRSSEFAYDERPPVTPPGQAPLVDFVVRTKRGYCQHYAGAMALMLRYLGIPARVAAGFTSGTYNDEKRRWTVSDHNAHAWVEVWFEGWGWLPFDPTPGRGQLSGGASSSSSEFNIQQALQELQRGRSGEAPGPSINVLRERLESADGRGPDIPGAIGAIDFGSERGASLLRLLAVVLLALAAVIVVAKLVVRGSRFLTQDPRRVAGACRSDLADFLRDQGLVVGRSATLAELGETLRRSFAIDAGRFVAAAGEARYGPPAPAADAARRARRELRALRRQLRRSLRLWDRATGLLSVRSLGFGAGSRG